MIKKTDAIANAIANPLLEDLWAFTKTESLLASFELGLFKAIVHSGRAQPQTLQALAKVLQIEELGLKRLLTLLQTWGYVTINAENLTVTPTQQTITFVESEAQQAGWLAYAAYIRQVQAAWGGLTSTLKQGTPTGSAFSLSEAEARFSNLNEGLRLLHEPLAHALFTALLADLPLLDSKEMPIHVVDVGAGSGVWSLPFLSACPQASVTFLDFPSVLTQAKNSAVLSRFNNRITLVACDFESSHTQWQTETITSAQVILIANVLRELSDEARINLLKMAWQQLAEGGVMAIVETLIDDDASQTDVPLASTVADLNLLATSFSSTGCLTKASLKQLCEQVFVDFCGVDFQWGQLESFKQQGLSVMMIKKTHQLKLN